VATLRLRRDLRSVQTVFPSGIRGRVASGFTTWERVVAIWKGERGLVDDSHGDCSVGP